MSKSKVCVREFVCEYSTWWLLSREGPVKSEARCRSSKFLFLTIVLLIALRFGSLGWAGNSITCIRSHEFARYERSLRVTWTAGFVSKFILHTAVHTAVH